MATEAENKSVVYQISLRTPNGEEEKLHIASNESATILRNRILMLPKLSVYTAYHFEVENTQGGQDLYLDNYTLFSDVPVIGEGATILLIPDLYDANSIRYQIRRTVALLKNKVPQISQLVKLNNEELPESLKDYVVQMEQRAKQVEEKKEPEPLNLKIRLDEKISEQDSSFKEMSLKDWEATQGTDLEKFITLFKSLNEETPVPVKSLSLSSYNPPSPSRRAMGDLIYLRVGLEWALESRSKPRRTTCSISRETWLASTPTPPRIRCSALTTTAAIRTCTPRFPRFCAPCRRGSSSGTPTPS